MLRTGFSTLTEGIDDNLNTNKTVISITSKLKCTFKWTGSQLKVWILNSIKFQNLYTHTTHTQIHPFKKNLQMLMFSFILLLLPKQSAHPILGLG